MRYVRISQESEKKHELTAAIHRCQCHRHSETPPRENQNLSPHSRVRTYVWIVPNWTLQKGLGKCRSVEFEMFHT